MKRILFAIVWIFLLVRVYATNNIYTYYHIEGNITNEHIMAIDIAGDSVTITYEEPDNTMIMKLSNEFPIYSSYLDKNGRKYLSGKYDYTKNKLVLSGKFSKEFNITENTIEDSGFFYMMKYKNPVPGHTIVIDLIQSRWGRHIEMNYTYVGSEILDIGGKKLEANKYKMVLNQAVMRLFWPYPYYYWYRKSDGLFLKYEGSNERKQDEIIILKELDEGGMQ